MTLYIVAAWAGNSLRLETLTR